MTEKPKIVYRVLVATMNSDDKAFWDCWSTWDCQAKAYAAMIEYREEWGHRDITPIRIVKLINPDRYGNSPDEAFIDETGTSIVEWERMVNAGEYMPEER
jgi:hypothetical protein